MLSMMNAFHGSRAVSETMGRLWIAATIEAFHDIDPNKVDRP
ncbi:hypothetical protein [Rhizobium sp. C4]|nr:hypothetical protein [Rhizobium sp. C4]